MFLVNGMLILVLFNSVATRSYVSLTLSQKFDVVPGALYIHSEVEIADDCTVSALRVHQDCVLVMSQVWFSIDLVPISLRGAARISVGMD